MKNLLLIIIFLFFGCENEKVNNENINGIGDTISQTTIETTSTIDENIPEDFEIKEPPLSERTLTATVPDFLNEEQIDLYRRVRSIIPAYISASEYIENFPRKDGNDYKIYRRIF